MTISAVVLLCVCAGVFHVTHTQTIPCTSSGAANLISNQNAKTITKGPSPITITSATFTPLANTLASKAGLPGATISEVIPNLQCGDVSLTGDLPIGGTIKVSGCFPVYGMVAVEGAVPSSGTAVVNTGVNSFAAQLVDNTCPKTSI